MKISICKQNNTLYSSVISLVTFLCDSGKIVNIKLQSDNFLRHTPMISYSFIKILLYSTYLYCLRFLFHWQVFACPLLTLFLLYLTYVRGCSVLCILPQNENKNETVVEKNKNSDRKFVSKRYKERQFLVSLSVRRGVVMMVSVPS